MAEKIKIGINFTHDENWIGGTYYITNLISSLNTLEERSKPRIIVISWNYSDFELIRQTGYPYIDFIDLSFPLNFFERAINKFSNLFFKKAIIQKSISDKQVDIVFPSHTSSRFDKVKHTVFWIPDFQEIYYPSFFTLQQIQTRKEVLVKIIDSGKTIVFSSQSAEADFRKLHPNAKNKTFVLNFAVTHPDYSSLNIDLLKSKYGITEKYFMVPNQFWIHKNQIIVLKAITHIIEREDFQVVFTGKESDVRNPDYFISLKQFVDSNSLSKYVRFLGFIDRREQLKLMSESIAIIQPSLFEGWSTVVEDAKAMGKFILLSDLDVHREQISEDCSFFDPTDDRGLSLEMKKIISTTRVMTSPLNYSAKIKLFASDFMKMIAGELK